MTSRIQNFLSIWWLRILTFILFSSLLLVSLDKFITLYHFDNIIYDSYLTQEFIFLFVLFLMSAIIEEFRAGNKWFAFGISFDTQTIKNSFWIAVIVCLSFFLILLLALIYSANIKLSYFSFTTFLYFFVFVFLTTSTEELLFRGIIFQAIQQKFGNISAILLTSIIFGILHLFNPYFNLISLLNTILAGALLGFLYIKSKTLITAIVFHFFWNFGQSFILNSNISGYDMYLKIFDINLEVMPHYLFGGNYGIEAGLITTFFLIIYFFIFNKLIKFSPYISSVLLIREIEESKLS